MVDYEWNAKAGEEELLSWRIYPGRRVGLTFKSMPSITQSQLVDLLTRLSDINKTMGEQ